MNESYYGPGGILDRQQAQMTDEEFEREYGRKRIRTTIRLVGTIKPPSVGRDAPPAA